MSSKPDFCKADLSKTLTELNYLELRGFSELQNGWNVLRDENSTVRI